MIAIDSVLLNLTERSCRAFQRLTGKTNVWLAVQLTNLSIVMYFVWAALWTPIIDVALQVLAGVFGAALLYVLTQTVFKVSIEAYETAAYRRVANGLRNPRWLRDAPLRTSFLTLSILLFVPVAFVSVNLRIPLIVLTYLLIVLTTLVLYLLACDPLPPCVGKVREWWRGRAGQVAGDTPVSYSESRSSRGRGGSVRTACRYRPAHGSHGPAPRSGTASSLAS